MIKYNGQQVVAIGTINQPAPCYLHLGFAVNDHDYLDIREADAFLKYMLQEANKQPTSDGLPYTVSHKLLPDGEWKILARCRYKSTAISLALQEHQVSQGAHQYKVQDTSSPGQAPWLYPDQEVQLDFLRAQPWFDKFILEEATKILTSKKEA